MNCLFCQFENAKSTILVETQAAFGFEFCFLGEKSVLTIQFLGFNLQIGLCDGVFAVQHFLRRTLENDLAAHGTATGTEFDEVVAGL